jgi:CheY-like chemotaxis protein
VTASLTTVLLVEDHHDVRRVMNLLLTRAGYAVVEASTVAGAISRVSGQPVAVLDLFLPDGTGTDVLLYIRRHYPQTRVAFTTAAFDLQHARSLLGPGDAIFTKPINFDSLLQWIDQDQEAAPLP